MGGITLVLVALSLIGVINADTCNDMRRVHSSYRSVEYGIITSPSNEFTFGETVNVTLRGRMTRFKGFKCQAQPMSPQLAVGQWTLREGPAHTTACDGPDDTIELTNVDADENMYFAVWRAVEQPGSYSMIEFVCYFYDLDGAEHYFSSQILKVPQEYTLPTRRTPPRDDGRSTSGPPTSGPSTSGPSTSNPHTGDHEQTGVHDPSLEDGEKPATGPQEGEGINPEEERDADAGRNPGESPSNPEVEQAADEAAADEADKKGALHETKTEDELKGMAEKKKQDQIDAENKANEDDGARKELQYEAEHEELMHWEEMEMEIRMKKEEDERRARIDAEIRDKEEYDRKIAEKPDIVINVDEEVNIIEEDGDKTVTAGSSRTALSTGAILFLSLFFLL